MVSWGEALIDMLDAADDFCHKIAPNPDFTGSFNNIEREKGYPSRTE